MRNKKNIVVTGGAGFIGSHLASRLLEERHKVTILDNLSTGREENIPPKAEFINTDLGREDTYERIRNIPCDIIFHLAGQSSGEASFHDPLYDLRSHVMSTFWLLKWCGDKHIPRFIYTSSMSTYGDPLQLSVNEDHPQNPKTYYAAAKISAEAYVKLYQTLGIDTTIFRLFSVYGPGQNLGNRMQGMVSIYLSYMLEGAPIVVKGSPERFRDLIYIDDVVNACITAMESPTASGKIYNVARGEKTKVKDILNGLIHAFGVSDYPITYGDGTPGDQFGVVADIRRIKEDLHWMPEVDLQTGLNKMAIFEKGRQNVEE